MKYLKRYGKFYKEDFPAIKENFENGGIEEEEELSNDNMDMDMDISDPIGDEVESESECDCGCHKKDDESEIESDIEAIDGGSELDSEEYPTMESKETETDDDIDADADGECSSEECSSDDDDEEMIEEGSIRKFFTGHEDGGERDEKMLDFSKALDKLDEQGADENPDVVYNRASIESKAKENNYKGGIRIQKGGRDSSKMYVIYDNGISGFEDLASSANAGRANKMNKY